MVLVATVTLLGIHGPVNLIFHRPQRTTPDSTMNGSQAVSSIGDSPDYPETPQARRTSSFRTQYPTVSLPPIASLGLFRQDTDYVSPGAGPDYLQVCVNVSLVSGKKSGCK
ncbi:hypothetical protein BDQ17DRAFT_1456094 [Cyathus striatus]|nr:hypothetical protein BDQ17DRAFT_1456094 [Cyathus striatus]